MLPNFHSQIVLLFTRGDTASREKACSPRRPLWGTNDDEWTIANALIRRVTGLVHVTTRMDDFCVGRQIDALGT